MSRRYLVLWVLAILAILGGLVVPSQPALAGDGPTMTVVASGLNNPRHITIGPDGAVYVAEAGRGGSGPCVTGPEGERQCFGRTGSITRIANGTQRRVVTGLPSLGGPQGVAATGPHAISVVRLSGTTQQGGPAPQQMYVLMGGAPRSALGDRGRLFGRLLRITDSGPRSVADLIAYEARRNPDRRQIDSNPFALLTLPGRHVVADAAGNSILQIKPDGTISTIAVLRTRMATAPDGSVIPMDAVPTSVARGPDGAYYIGQLTGFPYPVRGARVYRKAPGEPMEMFRRNFTNIIDVEFGRDGSLYVLEIAKNGLLAANPADPSSLTGRLVRVYPNGRRVVVASNGLIQPTGMAVARDGTIYVSNYGVLAGRGQVVRIRQ